MAEDKTERGRRVSMRKLEKKCLAHLKQNAANGRGEEGGGEIHSLHVSAAYNQRPYTSRYVHGQTNEKERQSKEEEEKKERKTWERIW